MTSWRVVSIRSTTPCSDARCSMQPRGAAIRAGATSISPPHSCCSARATRGWEPGLWPWAALPGRLEPPLSAPLFDGTHCAGGAQAARPRTPAGHLARGAAGLHASIEKGRDRPPVAKRKRVRPRLCGAVAETRNIMRETERTLGFRAQSLELDLAARNVAEGAHRLTPARRRARVERDYRALPRWLSLHFYESESRIDSDGELFGWIDALTDRARGGIRDLLSNGESTARASSRSSRRCCS